MGWSEFGFFLKKIILKRFLEKQGVAQDFSFETFTEGANQALVKVSDELSKGNFGALEGIVTPKLIEELREATSNFSAKQKADIKIELEEITSSHPVTVDVN